MIMIGYCQGGQRIENIVFPHHFKDDRHHRSAVYHIECRTASVICDIDGPVAAIRTKSVKRSLTAVLCPDIPQQLIIPIQKKGSAPLHSILNTEFLLQDILTGAKIFDMRNPDIGDYGRVHAGNVCNYLHLPRFTHPQLQNSDLICLRNIGNCNRNSHLAVVIGRCLEGSVSG